MSNGAEFEGWGWSPTPTLILSETVNVKALRSIYWLNVVSFHDVVD